jgi:hypothetical protein
VKRRLGGWYKMAASLGDSSVGREPPFRKDLSTEEEE